MIDPILPEEASPPPPVLPFESSPPSDPNDMDIDDIEDARLEFQSTEETPKQGKKSSDGLIDPDAPITDSHPSPDLPVESSPHEDPTVIDIDDVKNSAVPDTHSTFDDTQTPHLFPINRMQPWMSMSIEFFLPHWITNKLLLMISNHLSNKIRAPKRSHLKVLNLLPSLHQLSLTTSILM